MKANTENKVTCALALIDSNDRLLIVHPTNASYFGSWSLPKGLPNANEPYLDAAARECFEETGLDVRGNTTSFIDCGRHAYTKGKDLHLFLYRMEKQVDVKDLTCESMVTLASGRTFPECDNYQVLSFDKLGPFLNKKQLDLVLSALQDLH